MTELCITLWIESHDDASVGDLTERLRAEVTGRRGDKIATDLLDTVGATLVDWQAEAGEAAP